nr:flagellar basal body rod protein FlgB [Desulfobulbaceae bacterium]
MPFESKMFGGVISSGQIALNARLEKQGLIQSNIANIETPGYSSQDFSFESVMANALRGQGKLARTNAKHIQLDPVELSQSMEYKSDKRPVDLDEEMQKISENQLMYQVTAKMLAKKFEGLRAAIDEGGK